MRLSLERWDLQSRLREASSSKVERMRISFVNECFSDLASTSVRNSRTTARVQPRTRPVVWNSMARRGAQQRDQTNDGLKRLMEELRINDSELESSALPKILILVGIPGSGKSTFARELEKRAWVRISQDELGSRKKCARKCTDALKRGHNIVIDRCNFNRDQRATWIKLSQVQENQVGCVFFALAVEECIARVQARTDHETLHPGSDVDRVVQLMANEMRPPERNEGISFCRFVRTADDFERVLEEISPEPATSQPRISVQNQELTSTTASSST